MRRPEGEHVSVRVVNATPHEIALYRGGPTLLEDEGVLARWPPAATVLRVDEEHAALPPFLVDGHLVPCDTVRYTGGLSGLPDPEPGVILVVSRIAAGAVPNRRDVYFPLEKRDADGRIIGCFGLGQFPEDGKVSRG